MSDDNFTRNFFQNFVEISAKTIEALVKNGYKTKSSLIFLDIEKDLPNIPEIPDMAQISFLRHYLAEYQTNQKALRQNIDKKLSDELVAITDTTPVPNICQSTAESMATTQFGHQLANSSFGQQVVNSSYGQHVVTSASNQISVPPKLLPFGGQQFLPLPLTGRELVPIAPAIHTLSHTYTPSSSSELRPQLYLDIPQQSDDILCLPSTSHSSHSISSTSSSTPQTSGQQPRRRRFVRINHFRPLNSRRSRVEPTLKTESPPKETITCDKSTDSRWVLKPKIKTEEEPIFTPNIDTVMDTHLIKQEFTEEDTKETVLKTTTIEKSSDVTTDEDNKQESEKVVPNVVPLEVNLNDNTAEEDSTESCDMTADPESTPKDTKKRRKRKKIYSLRPLKNDNKSPKRRSDSSLSPIRRQPERVTKGAHNYSLEISVPEEEDNKIYYKSKTPPNNKTIKRRKKSGLSSHKKSQKKRSVDSNPYLCMIDGCELLFTNFEELRLHRLGHRPQSVADTSGSSLESKESMSDSEANRAVAERVFNISDMERTASLAISTLKKSAVGSERVVNESPKSSKDLNSEPNPIVCRLGGCAQRFANKIELTNHLKTVHFRKCPHCNRKFAGLVNHKCGNRTAAD